MARKPKETPKETSADEPEQTAIDIERAEQARVEAVLKAGERERIRNIKVVTG